MLVDINEIAGLDSHQVDADGTIRIGALCRHADLEHSTVLPSKQPTMAAAAPLIADPIVRNRGTLVGSLCHADPQGDWASVITALGGHVVAQGSGGRRHGRLPDSWARGREHRRMLEIGVAAQRTNANRAVGVDLVSIEARDLVDVDEHLGRGEPQLQQRDQALSPCQHLCLSAAVAQQRDRFVERARRFVPEPGRVHTSLLFVRPAPTQACGADAGSGIATGSDS
jgi:hypothetical protein